MIKTYCLPHFYSLFVDQNDNKNLKNSTRSPKKAQNPPASMNLHLFPAEIYLLISMVSNETRKIWMNNINVPLEVSCGYTCFILIFTPFIPRFRKCPFWVYCLSVLDLLVCWLRMGCALIFTPVHFHIYLFTLCFSSAFFEQALTILLVKASFLCRLHLRNSLKVLERFLKANLRLKQLIFVWLVKIWQ